MIELQRKLLGDRARNEAFAAALKKVIVPGKTIVADIGAGTGFLSFLALKYGAKECYLYEHSPILELAKKLAKENGLKNLHFIPKTSILVKKPVLADVVVSETLGNHALEEDILQTMNDTPRFLKAGGTLIPQKLEQCVAPLFAPRIFEDVNVWDKVGHGLSFQAAKQISLSNIYVKTFRPEELGSEKRWDSIDLRTKNKLKREGEVSWELDRDQTLYGLAYWWRCELLPGISISTSPFDAPTHWEQIYLPLFEALPLKKGDLLRAKISCQSSFEKGFKKEWQIDVLRSGKSVSTQKLRTL